MTARTLLGLGALVAAVGVAAGAFGAHGLRSLVTPDRVATFETGARYAVYHGLALVACGLAAQAFPGVAPLVGRAGWLFLAGVVLFTGSLFALVLLDKPWLGAITPLGGVAFLAGWALLAWTFLRSSG